MKKFLSVVCLAALFSSSVNANDNIAEFELGINDSNNIDVILKVKEDLKINNIRGFKGNCKIYYLKYKESPELTYLLYGDYRLKGIE